MTTITVGNGASIQRSPPQSPRRSGDTINVDAGTYTDNVLVISHSLTLQAVGGTVNLVGTTQPANQKVLLRRAPLG